MSLFSELNRRNVLRVAVAYLAAAWLLTQVAGTFFPMFGFGDTPARIVVILLAIGFPLFLAFAWVFEITPEGLKLEKSVDRSALSPATSNRRLDRAIIVLMALALGYFGVDKFVLQPGRVAEIVKETARQARSDLLVESYGDKSIAVLAFDDLSPTGDQEYFSNGISEELLNLLTRVPELRVISRSSAFSFKGRNLEIPDIAKRLNVAHILEGSVRTDGNRVRITAQLVDARSDTQLWSESYDRTLDNVFAIQDEIAVAVVEKLKITLIGRAPQAKQTDSKAYALYLQARQLGRQNTAESFDQSNALYMQALVIDPNYAPAWSGLSTNYSNQVGSGLRPSVEGIELARKAADRALVIDPGFAIAHLNLGWLAMRYDNDLRAAARHLDWALQLDPSNPEILDGAAALLHYLGRVNQAIVLKERAVARDPVNPVAHYNLGGSYLSAGRWGEAIASYEAALRLSPGYIGAHFFIGVAELFETEIESAAAEFEKESDEEYRLKGQALTYYQLGQTERFAESVREMIERWGNQWPSEVAHVYAFVGDADKAFKWLERAIDANEEGLAEQFLLPFYRPIHNDPRWADFLGRVGSSPERLGAIRFDVSPPK